MCEGLELKFYNAVSVNNEEVLTIIHYRTDQSGIRRVVRDRAFLGNSQDARLCERGQRRLGVHQCD